MKLLCAGIMTKSLDQALASLVCQRGLIHVFSQATGASYICCIYTYMHLVHGQALACLSEEDRNLDPIVNMLPLLKCGIAMHHSGLLPILKEMVEILFQEGYIKARRR